MVWHSCSADFLSSSSILLITIPGASMGIRIKAKNINGEDCPDDSDSHGCPRYCDEQNGEVLCQAFEDHLGCKPKALCMKKTVGADGRECPSHSVCPKECKADEMLCGDGEDSNNCKNADRCLPR